MAMSALSLRTLFFFTLGVRHVHGHGAVIKPIPRAAGGIGSYCPWCVGEHVAANRYGIVNKEAKLSHPCGGTSRGEAVYPRGHWGEFQFLYPNDDLTYEPGGSFESIVVLNADHNGEAQWQLCPHSEAETDECFRRHPIDDWTDVHSYWDASNEDDHWKSGEYFPQRVALPSNLPEGPATLRWFWVCRFTDEIFTSCVDVNIGSGGSPSTQPLPQPNPQPVPQPSPRPTPPPAPQPDSVPGGLSHYCYIAQCGCPPFDGGASWCDANNARTGSGWCQANSNQCGDCNGKWCDVASQGLVLSALAGPEVHDRTDAGADAGVDLVSGGHTFRCTLALALLGVAFW